MSRPLAAGAAAYAHAAGDTLEKLHVERLLSLRLNMLARQARRYPWPVLVSAAFLAFIAWPYVHDLWIVAWIVALGAILVTRWIYCGRVADLTDMEGIRRALHRILALSMANGFTTGMAVVLFFPRLPGELQGIFTMVMVCWAAGAASANAPYPPSFYAYAVPIMAPLAAAWAAALSFAGIGIGVLILLFLLLQVWLVYDNERILTRSFDVRFENEQLLLRIKEEQQRTMEERDRAEEATSIATAERDRAEAAHRSKNTFLAAASHDLRQPLFAVNAGASVLSGHADPTVRNIGQKIGNAVDAVELQLKDLLELARLDSGAIEPRDESIPLARLASEVMDSVREEASLRGQTIGCSVDPSIVVTTDRVMLGRILRNLVQNAVKFTSRGGSIELAARLEPQALGVEVIDTGRGIPPHEQQHIFEEYYQLRPASGDQNSGSGLGLSIVRRFARLLGFDIQLASQVGVGSTFRIAIPRSRVWRTESPLELDDTAHAEHLPSGLRVLVVDDDAMAREALTQLLESWGCATVGVATADEATAAASVSNPELIVSDYHLGPGVTALDAIARLRGAGNDAPAIIVTADSTVQSQAAVRDSGFRVIEKGAKPMLLRRAIHEVLAS